MLDDLRRGIQSLIFPVQQLTDLPRVKPPWCSRCGRSLEGLGAGVTVCLTCRQNPPRFHQVVSPLRYEGSAKELILAFKFRGRLSLAPFLGGLLSEAVRQRLALQPTDRIIPVPLHPTRLRERGFNQALLLARVLEKNLGIPCLPDLLLRVKFTPAQASLTRGERQKNTRGAFALRGGADLSGLRVILVDDVFTTGATASACARALKKGGATQVLLATIAQG